MMPPSLRSAIVGHSGADLLTKSTNLITPVRTRKETANRRASPKHFDEIIKVIGGGEAAAGRRSGSDEIITTVHRADRPSQARHQTFGQNGYQVTGSTMQA